MLGSVPEPPEVSSSFALIRGLSLRQWVRKKLSTWFVSYQAMQNISSCMMALLSQRSTEFSQWEWISSNQFMWWLWRILFPMLRTQKCITALTWRDLLSIVRCLKAKATSILNRVGQLEVRFSKIWTIWGLMSSKVSSTWKTLILREFWSKLNLMSPFWWNKDSWTTLY